MTTYLALFADSIIRILFKLLYPLLEELDVFVLLMDILQDDSY